MITFRNLTPHAINVLSSDGTHYFAIQASGEVARVVYDTLPPEMIPYRGFDIAVAIAGSPREIIGLPDPEPGVVCIVSKAVADAAPPSRGDLVSPGRLIRDADGNVVGCDGFTRRA